MRKTQSLGGTAVKRKAGGRSDTAQGCLLSCTVTGLPESVNRIWRNAGRHTYKSARAKEWQSQAVAIMRSARKYPPFDGPVRLVMRLTRHDRRRWDLDNRIKCVQDCLAPAGVILDDVQVCHIDASKTIGAEDKTEIEVWRMEAEQ